MNNPSSNDRMPINIGHGHVWARPDGVKARCGGPGMCSECSRDLANKQAAEQKHVGAERFWSNDANMVLCVRAEDYEALRKRFEQACARVTELESGHETSADARDAARYRWLKSEDRKRMPLATISWRQLGSGLPCKLGDCDSLDNLIDAAIAAPVGASVEDVYRSATSSLKASAPLTLGRLILETANSDQKERTLTQEEAAELREHIAKALEPIRAKYRSWPWPMCPRCGQERNACDCEENGRDEGVSTEAFEKLARELEEEARQSESTCIRNYGGIEPTNEQRIRAGRKAASLVRQLGCENFLGALGLKITRKP